jgi:hypothetical protein
MEMWKLLLIIGIIILIVYFYNNNKEFFSDTIGEPYNKYVEKIYERSKQIPSYPIDIDRKMYAGNVNVKMNRIFGNMVELNNKEFSYPIVFNSALKPIEHSDETNNTAQINNVIKYLETKFNTYDSNWQIKVNKVNKLIKHLIPNQLQYDILLNITITIQNQNKQLETINRDVFMTVIITKYLEQSQSSFEVYLKSLNLANMDHYEYLSGLEKRLNLETLDDVIQKVKNEKKTENQKETDGLTHVFDPKYPEYSIYETFENNPNQNNINDTITLGSDSVFMPSNNIDRYSNCNPTTVHTEDVLDIFQ